MGLSVTVAISVGLAVVAFSSWLSLGIEWSSSSRHSLDDVYQASKPTKLYSPMHVKRLTVWTKAARQAARLLKDRAKALRAKSKVRLAHGLTPMVQSNRLKPAAKAPDLPTTAPKLAPTMVPKLAPKSKHPTRKILPKPSQLPRKVRTSVQRVIKRLLPDRSIWSDWKLCASHGQMCTCHGQLRINPGQLNPSKAWVSNCWNPATVAASTACGIRVVQGHIPCDASLPGYHQQGDFCYCSNAKAGLNGKWQDCAAEDEPLFFSGMVQFGYGMKWTTPQHLNGSGLCTEGQFHKDPCPGQRKKCKCQLVAQ